MRNINVITEGLSATTTIFDCASGERIANTHRLEVIFQADKPVALGKLFTYNQDEPEDVRVWFDTNLKFFAKHV